MSFPQPIIAPQSVPAQVDRVELTLTWPHPEPRVGWITDRLSLIPEVFREIEPLFAHGFGRSSKSIEAALTFTPDGDRSAQISLEAEAITPVGLSTLIRLVGSFHETEGFEDIVPAVALSEGLGGLTMSLDAPPRQQPMIPFGARIDPALADALVLHQYSEPKEDGLFTLWNASIVLPPPPQPALLAAADAFVAQGLMVPLGEHADEPDAGPTIDYVGGALRLHGTRAEPAMLVALIRSLWPDQPGPYQVHVAE